MPRPAAGPGVRVAPVSRAMRVLEAFAGHPEGVALSRLAAKLGHGKASLSKILGTLAREGFVRQDPLTARFHLGWRPAPPALAAASARVWLPHLPEAQALAILARDGLRRLTPRTLTSRAKLAAQLRQGRARGYAIGGEGLVGGGGGGAG